MPQQELPPAAHADVDSMLSRKFGKEVANYFSGSPLNRVSFLRADSTFLSRAWTHPTTRFVLFNALAPLAHSQERLFFGPLSVVKSLTGPNPFEKTEDEITEQYDSAVTTPQLIFLGLDERTSAAGQETQKEGEGFEWKEYKGAPVFAVDVTPKGSIKEECEKLIKEVTEEKKLQLLEGSRNMILTFPAQEAAIYAQARALIDWNARNPFCANCGQPTLSINAGGKRICPPTDMARPKSMGVVGSTTASAPSKDREPCITRKGVHNIAFPRTDATIIVAVLSADCKRIMLGRQKRWPQYFYSTLAGFVEPAESIEEATRREVWEESGIRLGRVVIHSTQVWPFPANLMIGAIGQALETGEKVVLENDPELENAKWFSIDEIKEALKNGTSDLGAPPTEGYKEGNLRLPPRTAIANQLITALVEGFATEAKL